MSLVIYPVVVCRFSTDAVTMAETCWGYQSAIKKRKWCEARIQSESPTKDVGASAGTRKLDFRKTRFQAALSGPGPRYRI